MAAQKAAARRFAFVAAVRLRFGLRTRGDLLRLPFRRLRRGDGPRSRPSGRAARLVLTIFSAGFGAGRGRNGGTVLVFDFDVVQHHASPSIPAMALTLTIRQKKRKRFVSM